MTSRILIVDLLSNNVLSAKEIDGILVAHGDQVTNESTEAFILRIITSQKRRDECFIKAFTDAPEGLLSGFSKIDKTLKALQVRNLYLYPRFHEAVKEELELYAPEVEELQQPLSPSMKEIQNAIVAALQTCMRELKNLTSALVEWTGEDLSMENCVLPNFHLTVKRQLEKDWHRLRPQTRQLVEDLRTLGTLFQILIQADCVRFWSVLNNIQTNSAGARYPSMWLLTPTADRLFRKAKDRIYKIVPGQPTAQVPNPVSRLVPVLEENPKWRLVKTVLSEIKEKEKAKREQTKGRGLFVSATILVLVKDDNTVQSLRSYLVEGRDRALASKFLDYLTTYNDKRRTHFNSNTASEEGRLLHEEEARLRKIMRRNRNVNQKLKQEEAKKRPAKINAVPDYMKKRRRIAIEKGRGEITGGQEDLERRAVLDEAVEKADHDLQGSGFDDGPDDDDIIYDEMFKASFPEEPRIIIRSFSTFEGDAGLVLADLDPSHVIMYDMNVSLVRSLEIHAAVNGRNGDQERLKLYILSFDASSEQKVFQKVMEREQSAFVRLIQHKRTMPPPILHVGGTQEMQQALQHGSVQSTYAGGALPLAMDTRRGQGKRVDGQEKRDIAVDVREFRSALPSILHQGGMRLSPVTLTVGDFVLSNIHCVERKSISDLFGSFASGRLYNQTEAMCKYYKVPVLLIEFDPNKAFCLQNDHELGMDIRTDSVCSKMVLLTSHFPKLRIVWSKSPHETLRIFKELKQNHEEVDVDRAVEVGRKDSEEALLLVPYGASGANGDDDEEEDEINEAARDMLLRLPGVNIHNARRIMRECDSLADLINMSRMELRTIAGPVAGQKLYTFFRQPYGATK